MENKYKTASIVLIITAVILMIGIMVEGANPSYRFGDFTIKKQVVEDAFDTIPYDNAIFCDEKMCVGFIQVPQKKIETVQDLYDYELEKGRVEDIVYVGEEVDTRGKDVPVRSSE